MMPTSILVPLVLSCLTAAAVASTHTSDQDAQLTEQSESAAVQLLQESESTTYMVDSIDDTQLFGTYWSLEALQQTAAAPKVLSVTAKGPVMVAASGKKDASMKPAVWKLTKGLAQEDCVSITPLMSSELHLRIQKIEVPVNPQPVRRMQESAREDMVADIGESVDSRGLFNALFLPGPHGATAVAYPDAERMKPDIQESSTVDLRGKGDAATSTATKTIMTVVVAKNDGSLGFLKDATWCVRNPRASSTVPGVRTVALESMAMPGHFLIRKTNNLVGVDLGEMTSNYAATTWQIASPKWELCPDNCNNHGKCQNVADAKGKCVCDPGYAETNCGVRAGWPLIDNTTAKIPANKILVQTMQAAVNFAGIPQPMDGMFSSKLASGVQSFTLAKKLLNPTTGMIWEALLGDAFAEKGWGKVSSQTNLVKAIQMLLNRRFNYELGEKPEGALERQVSGQFDEKTVEALKNFQGRFHLEQSGRMGLDTWSKLVGLLPGTLAMWPLEKNYRPYPDEQIFFAQDNQKSVTGNCRLNGHFEWSDDLPNSTIGTQYIDDKGQKQTGTKSLYFDFKGIHKGGYAECNDLKGQFNGAREMTVEMFFNPSTISQRGTLFSACDEKMTGPHLEYRGTELVFSISGQSSVHGKASMQEDTWHHVAATFNGTSQQLRLFLDGKLLKESNASEASIPWVSKSPGKQVAPVFGGFSGDLRYRRFWGKLDNIYLSRVARKLDQLSVPGSAFKSMILVPKSRVNESKVTFSYLAKSPKGPASWSGKNKAWKACGTGQQQSPIDLPPAVQDPLSKNDMLAAPARHLKYVSMSYASSQVSIIYAENQIGLKLASGGTLTLNSDSFDAKRILFHTPSEHTIDSLPTEMELEIIHTMKDQNQTAIVSVLVKRGIEMPGLKSFFGQFGTKKAGDGIGNLDLTDIIPFDPGFLVYKGSLSQPPCTENSTRIVIDKPITASMEQINAIKSIVGNNARPVQTIGVRKVYRLAVDTLEKIEEALVEVKEAADEESGDEGDTPQGRYDLAKSRADDLERRELAQRDKMKSASDDIKEKEKSVNAALLRDKLHELQMAKRKKDMETNLKARPNENP